LGMGAFCMSPQTGTSGFQPSSCSLDMATVPYMMFRDVAKLPSSDDQVFWLYLYIA
jgi:hypothetical protein